MSQVSLQRFMTEVAANEDLQARIGDESDGEDLIALGAKHGWEFTTEELLASAELSDEELESVAGGSSDVVKVKSTTTDTSPRPARLVVTTSTSGASNSASHLKVRIRSLPVPDQGIL